MSKLDKFISDGSKIRLYSSGNEYLGTIQMEGSALSLSGPGTNVGVAEGHDLVFLGDNQSIGTSNSGILNIGISGDVVDLNVSGVTYNLNTGSFITSGQTGVFVTTSQTGVFVTTSQTGVFVTTSQTGGFVTTGQTGVYANADLLDGYHLSGIVPYNFYTASADATTGILIDTDISSGYYALIKGHIRGSSFNNLTPSYLFFNANLTKNSPSAQIINPKAYFWGVSSGLSMFLNSGRLNFYLPINYFTDYEVYVTRGYGYVFERFNKNHVTSINYATGLPTGISCLVTVTPTEIYSSGSLINADTLDGQHGTYYVNTGQTGSFITASQTGDFNWHNSRAVLLCAGYTPTSTGADAAEVPLPYSYDGITSLTWNIKRCNLRVQTPGGAPSISLQKSSGTGEFIFSGLCDVTLSTGAYEASTTGISSTVQSADKLRFFVNELGSAQNWTISVEIAN